MAGERGWLGLTIMRNNAKRQLPMDWTKNGGESIGFWRKELPAMKKKKGLSPEKSAYVYSLMWVFYAGKAEGKEKGNFFPLTRGGRE